MKLMVLGNSVFCTAFKLAGVLETMIADNIPDQIETLLNDKDAGVIIVQQDLYEALPNKIKKSLDKTARPIFVPLSLEGKETGEGLEALIKRALGVDIK